MGDAVQPGLGAMLVFVVTWAGVGLCAGLAVRMRERRLAQLPDEKREES